MRKVGSVLLSALFFSSCSLFTSRLPTYPSGIIFPLEKAEERVYKGEIVTQIQKEDRRLYLTTRKGFVYCFNGEEQALLWNFEAGEPLECPPCLGIENLFFYDRENVLFGLRKNGQLIWKTKMEERITSGVGEYKGSVFIGTEKGNVVAFDSSTGERLWNYQAEKAVRSRPVFSDKLVIFGCDDHNLYFLDEKGHLIEKVKIGGKVQSTPLVEKDSLYFGADDQYFYCFDLSKRKKKWRIKTGGRIFTSPVADKKRIFFLCWNNVLYCLNKENGTLLWWNPIPSRSLYDLEIIERRIVVSTLSSTLICFNIETGERTGEYDAGAEVKSNPSWLDPFLVINLYDELKEEGRLVFLKKLVSVKIESDKESPQPLGEEILFEAFPTGFFKPKFEFYLSSGEKKDVVQENSEEKTWKWFPEKWGEYVIGVQVSDERESARYEISFDVRDEEFLEKQKEKIEGFILFLIRIMRISRICQQASKAIIF